MPHVNPLLSRVDPKERPKSSFSKPKLWYKTTKRECKLRFNIFHYLASNLPRSPNFCALDESHECEVQNDDTTYQYLPLTILYHQTTQG